MKMEFVRHDPCKDRVLFVLTLDRKKMRERVTVGTETEVRSLLAGYADADVLFDMTRPLGTLLIDFEHDPEGKWNICGLAPLREALHSNRWKQPDLEKASADFLREKYDSGNPLCMYTAFRIWNDYLVTREYRERDKACERFMQRMGHITMMFQQDSPLRFDSNTGKPQPFRISSRTFGSAPVEDTRLDLWFPDRRRLSESVSTYASFYPLVTYYLNRLDDWGLCFCKCKVCDRVFLAKSLRYALCSDKCRKKQSLQNKREFDERARANNYDLVYKNECQNWRNKINKAKKTSGFPPERLGEMQAAFEVFKREALKRKKAVKEKAASPKEFTDWLLQQGNLIVTLAEWGA